MVAAGRKGRGRARVWAALAIFAILLSACAPRGIFLSPTPNLYRGASRYPAQGVPVVLRDVAPALFFVTDRAPLVVGGQVAGYAPDRSNAMAFGAARVRFGAADWDDLLARTHADEPGTLSRMEVRSVREIVRFSETPLPTLRQRGRLEFEPGAQSAYRAQGRALQAAIRAEIARTGNSRVLVYAHGVSNDFEDSLTTLASLWHFAGRRSIPIAFSWPAGNPGVLGYFRDREAGDFSVFHAKEFLRLLAEIDAVSQIDIVAHSRGTDVMTKAVREMVIFNRGRGRAPQPEMKTGTLILAAADLDIGVVRQRLEAERVEEAFDQINVYVNPGDLVLRLSSVLGKGPRIGSLGGADLTADQQRELRGDRRVHFIRVVGAGRRESHSYFRQNPAVLSDIVLALRTGSLPGSKDRPLERDQSGIWVLRPSYPLARPAIPPVRAHR